MLWCRVPPQCFGKIILYPMPADETYQCISSPSVHLIIPTTIILALQKNIYIHTHIIYKIELMLTCSSLWCRGAASYRLCKRRIPIKTYFKRSSSSFDCKSLAKRCIGTLARPSKSICQNQNIWEEWKGSLVQMWQFIMIKKYTEKPIYMHIVTNKFLYH